MARVFAILNILVLALVPSVAQADGVTHHVRPEWVTQAEQHLLAGWTYYSPGGGKLYGFGPIPIAGQKAHVVVWYNRRFMTQFAPASGKAYVMDAVLNDARAMQPTSRAALLATRPLSIAQFREYWRTGTVLRIVASTAAKAAPAVGTALAGPSGIGVAALPCGAWQAAGVLRCQEDARE